MASKFEAKKKISELIDKYERFKLTEEYSSLSEEATCLKFILPLFHALGWDIEGDEGNMDEVQAQAPVANQKRVDYAFNINGQVSFFLEAKKLSEDLYNEDFAWQSINYGYNRSVKYVVLSDFEGLIVFNTTVKKKRISDKTVIKLKYTDFLSNLDTLWLLSKDSISNGKLNEYAKEHGHVENKVPINELLLSKLLVWRDKLMKEVKSDRNDLSADEMHECVQKLLNRLIFIRTCEDRQIEKGIILNNILNECRNDNTKSVWQLLLKVFRTFGNEYDSNLFEMHEIDKTKISSDFLWDVIAGLYEDPKEDVKFDFAVIPDDILGKIYEQYLGIIQKGENLAGKEKRKSHGIYYTPKYIVDYIVENTLGKVLDELLKNKEYSKIGNLKVLDPACGSGSFLIKALQKFDDVYAQTPADKDYPKTRKLKALASNIYGVDLDAEAVELTKLNLLLSAVSSRRKLPNLDQHIECGNSLIDDPKVAGDKAFDWKKRFPEVMDKGKDSGFDVIIGNPPYIFARGGKFSENEKKYYYGRYQLTGYQINTYLLFLNLAIQSLNKDGSFGFIMPNTWLTIDTFANLRKFLIEQTRDLHIINLYDKVFQDANVDTCILLFRMGKPNQITLGEFVNGNLNMVGKLLAASFKTNNYIINISLAKDKDKKAILDKITNNSNTLNTHSIVKAGLKAYETGQGTPHQTDEMKEKRIYHSEKRVGPDYAKYLEGRDVRRYKIDWSGAWLKYGRCLAAPREKKLFTSPRILVRQIPSIPPYSINAVFTKEYMLNDINSMVIYGFHNINPYYVLAILNTRVTTFWFINTFDKMQRKIFPQFKVKELALFPIPSAKKNEQGKIAKIAKVMLTLQEKYARIKGTQTAAAERLKSQIEDTDREIDRLVYKLYGLTKEEIRVVEGKNDKQK